MDANDARRRPLAPEPIRPERVRSIDGQGFAFIPNRFLRDGFLAALAPDELRLYVLLVLASDRRGLSFYHYDTLCSILEVTLDEYIAARDGLIAKDLVAYDGTRFQVLSLPVVPVLRASRTLEPEPPDRLPNETRRALLASLRHPLD
jgi:hypothetical protein